MKMILLALALPLLAVTACQKNTSSAAKSEETVYGVYGDRSGGGTTSTIMTEANYFISDLQKAGAVTTHDDNSFTRFVNADRVKVERKSEGGELKTILSVFTDGSWKSVPSSKPSVDLAWMLLHDVPACTSDEGTAEANVSCTYPDDDVDSGCSATFKCVK